MKSEVHTVFETFLNMIFVTKLPRQLTISRLLSDPNNMEFNYMVKKTVGINCNLYFCHFAAKLFPNANSV